MIDYDGQEYEIIRSHWGGEVYAYLIDGRFTYIHPTYKVYVGYIQTTRGVIEVWRSKVPVKYLVAVAVMVVLCIISTCTKPETEYYRVSFAEVPIYTDGTLYCSVVNVSNREVTVQFLGEDNSSELILLRPGDTIPTIELDFVPALIQYDQNYSFELEVQYDGF